MISSYMIEGGAGRGAFAAFLLLLAVVASAGQINTIPDSQSQTQLGGANQIVGTVFAPSGRPLERPIQVRLSTMTRGDRVVTTTETGNFAFKGLPRGTYTITINKEKDYEPFSQTVDLIQFRGGPPQLHTMNIRLIAKTSGDAPPAVVNAEFANVPAKAQAYYFEAVTRSNNGDRAGAIEQLKLAIEEFPAFMHAHNELGVQYLRLNRLQDADASFQEALKIAPEAFSPLVNHGIANYMMKRYGEVVPIFRRAVKMNQQSDVAHYFLGQALANLGLFTDAEKELLRSLELGKENMKEAHRVLTVIYIRQEKRKKAIEHLETYIQLAPHATDAANLRQKLSDLKKSG